MDGRQERLEIIMTYEKDSFDREDYLTEEDWEELASEHLAEMIAERRITLTEDEKWLL